MTALNDVVFARCASTHQRLAVDALRHLDCEDGTKWRNLLLHFHERYLAGVQAPDEKFKDFKNHVCHVDENFWGGAPDAAETWYGQTVAALTRKDWKTAAYTAGVTTHYIVDPLQPLHTGQCEAGNAIHRAVEQSVLKSYGVFQTMLATGEGYRRIALPTGPGWLAQTVRNGALAAHALYDMLIDHYDFARGAKNPLQGFDQSLRSALAPLIGRAVITIAQVIECAIAEAGVKPSWRPAALDALTARMTSPLHWATNARLDAKARAVVVAMHKEFAKTGKVVKTLPADERQVRALHAQEVLSIPLSQLDAQTPRPIGAAHGRDAVAEQGAARAGVSARDDPAGPKKRASPRRTKIAKDPDAPPKTETPASAPPKRARKKTPAAAAYDPHSPFAVLAPGGALDRPALEEEGRGEDLDRAPSLVPAPSPGVRLHPDDLIIDAPAIGPKAAARFEAIGYKTVADLLDASAEDAAKSLRASHMTPPIIRDWQAQALLACTLPNVRSIDAQALVACGVRDGESLAKQDAKKLLGAIDAYLRTPAGKNIARSSKPATLDTVRAWIDAAKSAQKLGKSTEVAKRRHAS